MSLRSLHYGTVRGLEVAYTDRQLVDMATSIPAHIAGIDDEVGAIRSWTSC
jgi:hypothetical protein